MNMLQKVRHYLEHVQYRALNLNMRNDFTLQLNLL